MGKIILTLMFISTFVLGEDRYDTLKTNCLACHTKEQIPNKLMYKRYLMKYSTNVRMEEVMFNYLKNPKKSNSIMPPPFFLKFPMCKKLDLADDILRNHIKQYLDFFDLKKHLILEK